MEAQLGADKSATLMNHLATINLSQCDQWNSSQKVSKHFESVKVAPVLFILIHFSDVTFGCRLLYFRLRHND